MSTSLLLAEDDLCLRQDLERHFINRQFHVQACPNGRLALAAMRDMRFDLVLLDIMLPDINGLSLLDELRRQVRRDEPADARLAALLAQELAPEIAPRATLTPAEFAVQLVRAPQRLTLSFEGTR